METLADEKGGVLDGKVPIEAFRESALARKVPLDLELPKPDTYSEERVAKMRPLKQKFHPRSYRPSRTRALALGWGLGMVIASALGAVVIKKWR